MTRRVASGLTATAPRYANGYPQRDDGCEWIASAPEQEIADVIKTYGEERFAKRMASAIVKVRVDTPITGTRQLASIIAEANPKWEPNKHPATRAFQAIRIFINRELEDLELALSSMVDKLVIGGRLVVISFHSLEDRIVKRFMRDQARGVQLPGTCPLSTVMRVRRSI